MAEILLARLDDIAAGGETNTASNVGSVGVGTFKQKTLFNLEFYKLNAASSKISIALSGTDRIDFDVVPTNIAIGDLSGTLAIAKGGTGQVTAALARVAFGFAVALDTLWTAVSLAAGRLALGFPVALDSVWTAVSLAAARLALGFPVALDAVWTAVSVAAARIALGFPAALDALWTATSTANARTALGLVIGTDVQAFDAATAKLNVEDQTLTGGANVTSKSLGTVTTGTLTPDPGDRPLQHYTANGAHTLAPGAVVGSYLLDIVNGASAGAITTSGWTHVAGEAFTTTNGHKFRCHCSIGSNGSLLVVEAMQ